MKDRIEISGFADEIAEDLKTQIEVNLEFLILKCVELMGSL